MSARQKHKPPRNEAWDAECQIRAMQALRRQLETLTDDEQAIADTIEGEADLGEVLDLLLKDRNRILAEKKGIEDFIKHDLKPALERKEAQVEKREKLLRLALETAGQRSWKGEVGSCSLTDGRFSVDVENEARVPGHFWKTPDPVLDKAAVKAALEKKLSEAPTADKIMEFRDPSIPGARLVRGIDILNIRKV